MGMDDNTRLERQLDDVPRGYEVPPRDEAPRDPHSRARIVFGLMVILFGAMALLEPLGRWWGVALDVHIWPFILMFLGLARFANYPEDRGSLRSGVWLILIGVWGVVNEYRIFGIHYTRSWPLLVIFAGLMIVWRAIELSTEPAV